MGNVLTRPDARAWLLPWLALSVACVIPHADAQEQPRSAAPSPRAEELLKSLESEDPYQRQLAFLRLEALREPSTVGLLEPYLRSGDPDMRAYSVRAIAAIEGAPAVPTLLQTLASDRHPTVRRAALLALEPLQQRNPEMLPALIKALRDRSPEVRMTALDVVSRIHDPRARTAVLLRNTRERDRDVRRVVTLAMRRIEHHE
ncbi:MAG: HEAT repeat domain-containing protein [Candidatus Omnitrophica bacterium]|nr:HEAT repeat domain-containing protein [Candidatus Omnitrophota bacterium]